MTASAPDTSAPDAPLRLVATAPDAHSVRIALHGDLDYATTALLHDAVGSALDGSPDLRDLCLDCAGLGFCDSSGLGALLLVRRRTAAADIRLRITGRGPQLNRLLDITGTMEYLTGEEPAAVGSALGSAVPSAGERHDGETPGGS
ncbi:STAS domain-containing protein [Actinomadura fibrosa]|uniref:Anti-sigma factor antagonist n=1 Tax=Actinomadura fibrosa TaxID=111802 RepID=A0ABW2XKW1_9ACTN|nr:STAS domain-containing protein [Actinomadura fibrosa]